MTHVNQLILWPHATVYPPKFFDDGAGTPEMAYQLIDWA
jgi:hypothetical protein